LATLEFSGFVLALIDPLYKLLNQAGESFGDRFRKVEMCRDFPPDELTKLGRLLFCHGLKMFLLVEPHFHGRCPHIF
jgi:hypothetical protein